MIVVPNASREYRTASSGMLPTCMFAIGTPMPSSRCRPSICSVALAGLPHKTSAFEHVIHIGAERLADILEFCTACFIKVPCFLKDERLRSADSARQDLCEIFSSRFERCDCLAVSICNAAQHSDKNAFLLCAATAFLCCVSINFDQLEFYFGTPLRRRTPVAASTANRVRSSTRGARASLDLGSLSQAGSANGLAADIGHPFQAYA
jgi:hypothetical protein